MKVFFLTITVNIIAAALFTTSSYAMDSPRSVVVMFGDSISVGFNSLRPRRDGDGSTDLGGPTQFLSDILNNRGAPRPKEVRPSTVVNWGEGGTNTARGLRRVSGTLSLVRQAYPDDRCFVLLMYGTNDFGFGLDASTTVFNTREMIKQIRSSGCTPIVGNLTPRSDRDLSRLSRAVGSAAGSERAIVVDHFSSFNARPLVFTLELERSGLTGELLRLHPKEVGYQLLVDNWFNQALKSLIAPVELPLVITPIFQLLLDDD